MGGVGVVGEGGQGQVGGEAGSLQNLRNEYSLFSIPIEDYHQLADLEFKELGSVVDAGEENDGNEVTEERLWVRHLKIPEHLSKGQTKWSEIVTSD